MRIETPSVAGSIALKGGRIDDLALIKYRETVDPKSPPIVLLAPSGARIRSMPSSAGRRRAARTLKLPDADTVWRQQGAARSPSAGR